MAYVDLHEETSAIEALTALSLDRVAAMMRGWWARHSLTAIAAEHGITRQRVGQVLLWCGCSADILQKSSRNRPDSPRRATLARSAEARVLLEHPFAARLTARQRGALLWLSQELILSDIARRMAMTTQGVHALIDAARARLERLALREAANTGPPIDAGSLSTIDLETALDEPPPVNVRDEPAPHPNESPPKLMGKTQGEINVLESDDGDEGEDAAEQRQSFDAEPPDVPDRREREIDRSPPQFGGQKPIRLSDYQRKKPQVWVRLWP